MKKRPDSCTRPLQTSCQITNVPPQLQNKAKHNLSSSGRWEHYAQSAAQVETPVSLGAGNRSVLTVPDDALLHLRAETWPRGCHLRILGNRREWGEFPGTHALAAWISGVLDVACPECGNSVTGYGSRGPACLRFQALIARNCFSLVNRTEFKGKNVKCRENAPTRCGYP